MSHLPKLHVDRGKLRVMGLKVVSDRPQECPAQPRMVRLEIQFDDGTVKLWTGENALRWEELTRLTGQDLPAPNRTFRLPGAGVKPGKAFRS